MKKNNLITIISIFSLITVLAVWHYIFAVYEIKSEISKKKIDASDNTMIVVSVYAINALGSKIPFRKIDAVFYVTEGASLIKINEENKNTSKFEFNTTGKTGEIRIKILSEYSLFPIIQQLDILPDK